jgi:hypothetical protein
MDTVLSADKIKQKKEYQRWRTRLRSYCLQAVIKKKQVNTDEHNLRHDQKIKPKNSQGGKS